MPHGKFVLLCDDCVVLTVLAEHPTTTCRMLSAFGLFDLNHLPEAVTRFAEMQTLVLCICNKNPPHCVLVDSCEFLLLYLVTVPFCILFCQNGNRSWCKGLRTVGNLHCTAINVLKSLAGL